MPISRAVFMVTAVGCAYRAMPLAWLSGARAAKSSYIRSGCRFKQRVPLIRMPEAARNMRR